MIILMMHEENMSFLSLMVQIWGLIATFALTFMCRRKKWARSIGPVLMFAVNFLAQNIIAGEGPGACVGAIVLPLYGYLVSRAALAVAKLLEHNRNG
jgi:hypothetical protein